MAGAAETGILKCARNMAKPIHCKPANAAELMTLSRHLAASNATYSICSILRHGSPSPGLMYYFWIGIQRFTSRLVVSGDPHISERSHWLDVLAASSRAGKRNSLEFAFILDHESDGRSHF